MAYNNQKIPSIQWIFEELEKSEKSEDQPRYTKKALLYQCIVSYAIILNRERPTDDRYESFTTWKLAGWLIDNFAEYRNEMKYPPYKNMSRGNKINAKLDGIESIMRVLMLLQLIEEQGMTKASRGKEFTRSINFTELGYLLAWIIESFDQERRENANIQIYNILEHIYKDRPSSFDIFAFMLMEKFRFQDAFEDFIANPLRVRVADPRWHIDSMSELIDSLSIPYSADDSKTNHFYDLWIETLNELEVSQRDTVMQYVKLNLGRMIEEQLRYLRGYEELRFSLRDRPDMLAVEGICNRCNRPHPATMNLFDYIKIEISPPMLNERNCPWCSSSNTASIPLPYY
jgi:hypothetical protein